MPSEYRVRWRRASWAPTTISVKHYQRRALAERFAAKLEESGEFETVELHRRKVGRWQNPRSANGSTAIEHIVSGDKGTHTGPVSPSPSGLRSSDTPMEWELSEDGQGDGTLTGSSGTSENSGYMSKVGEVLFPNPEHLPRRWW